MNKNIELIEFREQLGISRELMSEKLGFSESYYTKIELGQRNPGFNFINKFKQEFSEADIEKIFFSKQSHVKCN